MKPLVFFDLETTGPEPASARIVEFAAMKVLDNGKRLPFQTLINPGVPITNSDLHHITDEMVKDAPSFNDIAVSLAEFLDGCDLSGFNIKRFDIPVLVEEFDRAGINWGTKGRRIIDTFLLYKVLYPQSLAAAYKKYTGLEIEGAHRAMADVEACAHVLTGIAHEDKLGIDAAKMNDDELRDSLVKFQQNGEEFDPMVDYAGKFIRNKEGIILFNFSKSKGVAATDDVGLLQWMLDKYFTRNTLKWVEAILSDGNDASV